MNRNQVAAAEQEFQWAIRLQPTEPVAYYNLGWIYQQTARPELARDQYRRILEIAPDFQLARQRLDELR